MTNSKSHAVTCTRQIASKRSFVNLRDLAPGRNGFALLASFTIFTSKGPVRI